MIIQERVSDLTLGEKEDGGAPRSNRGPSSPSPSTSPTSLSSLGSSPPGRGASNLASHAKTGESQHSHIYFLLSFS